MTTPPTAAASRRSLVIFLLAGIVILAACAVGVAYVLSAGNDAPAKATTSEPQIAGVQRYDDLGRDHVSGPVHYQQHPPVGGDHDPVWLNCGVYDSPVPARHAVHSLEHGAVWIAYDETRLNDDEIDELTDLASESGYLLLVSPENNLNSPIVLTAWGRQLEVPNPDDERVEKFLDAYVSGPTAPELGAPCIGGTGSPVS